MRKLVPFLLLLQSLTLLGDAQVRISEVHYNPVEETVFDGTTNRTFNAAGVPIFSDTLAPADFTDNVHEFIEIQNRGAEAVDLSGWSFSSGVEYTFPAGTTVPPGAFKVIAKDAARIQTKYGITDVLGNYQGKLSNDGEAVTLVNAAGAVIDSVNYSARFPWAQSADALGAAKDWLGFDPAAYQYKGRSLERVSFTASANDPANWLASPLETGPTPGTANTISRPVPKPVVVAFSATHPDGSPAIRPANSVSVSATFSSTVALSNVQLEYFVDNIEIFTETVTTLGMTEAPVGSGQYTATIPASVQLSRGIVRFRFKADRGEGSEIVSPRADDPKIVPAINNTRTAWHAYFVAPPRASANPVYDCFVSSASLGVLNNNISQSPRRVTSNGDPREIPYVAATDPQWNGTQPAVVVHKGVVYDIRFRHHGSRYRRGAGRQSYKWQFPRCNLFQGTIQEIFETDKNADTSNSGKKSTEWGHQLYRAAGIPTSYTAIVDLYLNNNGMLQRLQQSVCDDRLLETFYEELHKRDPSQPLLTPGDVYKVKGTDEGANSPYVNGYGQLLTASRTSGTGKLWTPLHQYRWTFSMQNNDWKGHKQLKDMVDSLWAERAKGSVAIRAWLAANWDIDRTLTYLAIRNWSCPWDDHFHNYYVYRQANGKWSMLPWDFDYEFGENRPYTAPIYETNGNQFKDTFLNFYRTEFNQKLWTLNNTLLTPANLQSMGINLGQFNIDRRTEVNRQLNLGIYRLPIQPVAQGPVNGAGATPPALLSASAYAHTSGNVSGVNAHAKSKWEIRASSGTWNEPLYVQTSTTNLTSLPIPFSELVLGNTYFWRVTYLDALDHPSTTSAEASFIFGVGDVTENLVVMDAGSLWKYNAEFAPTNLNWTTLGYDDSSWLSGAAPLGHSPSAALPVAIRTVIPPTDRVSFYFRKGFTYSGSKTATTVLRLRHYIDDGVVLYLNGTELKRTRMSTSADQYALAASGWVGDPTLEPSSSTWFTVPTAALQNGENILAASVHQFSGDTADFMFGLDLQVTYTPGSAGVVINEVMADNQRAVSNGGAFPDYVEFYNKATVDVDMGGLSLSDDSLNPNKFVFPVGTVVPGGSYLMVWCDNDLAAPGIHTGFKLSAGGGAVTLYSGTALVDYVTYGVQAPGLPIGRIPNGTGVFTLNDPSAGATNIVKSLGNVSGLRLNEWMARPSSGDDWIEIHNTSTSPVPIAGLYLSDSPNSPTNTRIPPLSFIAARGYTRFDADGTTAGGNHLNFALSANGEQILLTNTDGVTVINSVSFGSQLTDVAQGRVPDGGPSISSFPLSGTPGASNYLPASIVINEALTGSSAPLEDAIELFNPTAGDVAIGGWWLSDDRTNLQKFQLPAGTVVPAGGFKVFYESQFASTPTGFALSSAGDELILSATDGSGNLTGFRAQVGFGAAADGVPFGRINTAGAPEFWPLMGHSFGQSTPASVAEFRTGSGAANAAPRIGPIIINEVMYHPPDGAGGADNSRDEFIELHNISSSAVDVSGWKLKGDADFSFPAGSSIPPGAYILVVSFAPGETATLDAFRAVYGATAGATVFGPYQPRMVNSASNIELAYPGAAVGTETPFILVDKVAYSDAAPWPTSPDGLGTSLQRSSRTVIGNDPGNWTAAAPTAGGVNNGQPPVGDSDGDGMPDSYELANSLNPNSAADAFLDSDADGQTNAAEYFAGTNPNSAADVFKAAVGKRAVGSGFVIRFPAKTNKSYSILYKGALGDANWTKLTDISAENYDRTIEHADPTTAGHRFYRIVTPQAP
jgi:hypothetical protein